LSYGIRVARSADSYLQPLPWEVQRRIADKLALIADDPFDRRSSKPLTATSDRRSARVGGRWINFVVDRDRQIVNVEEIGPRGQLYRRL